MDRDRLIEIVRALLADANGADLTQLAEACGVTTPLAYHWRSGERAPAPDKLSALLRHLKPPREVVQAAWAAAGVDLSTLDGDGVTA
jgi:hypothetical protein